MFSAPSSSTTDEVTSRTSIVRTSNPAPSVPASVFHSFRTAASASGG